MRKYRLFILLAALVAFLPLYAQSEKPATWRLIVKMTSATEGELIVKCMVEPGWHVYGTDIPKGGPKPTVLDFSGCEGIQRVGPLTASPKAIHGMDEMFGINLSWWDNAVSFRQKFKVTDRSRAKVKCEVRYMGCNNKRCSQPLVETLTKTVK